MAAEDNESNGCDMESNNLHVIANIDKNSPVLLNDSMDVTVSPSVRAVETPKHGESKTEKLTDLKDNV